MDSEETESLLKMVSLEAWNARKAFIGFGPADEEILQELCTVAQAYADEVIEEFYTRLLAFPEVRRFFPEDSILARVKVLQQKHFISLTSGNYGVDYLVSRLRVGLVHKRIGLPPDLFIGGYAIYLQIVIPRVLRAFEYDRVKQTKAVIALTKLLNLDHGLSLLFYFQE